MRLTGASEIWWIGSRNWSTGPQLLSLLKPLSASTWHQSASDCGARHFCPLTSYDRSCSLLYPHVTRSGSAPDCFPRRWSRSFGIYHSQRSWPGDGWWAPKFIWCIKSVYPSHQPYAWRWIILLGRDPLRAARPWWGDSWGTTWLAISPPFSG